MTARDRYFALLSCIFRPLLAIAGVQQITGFFPGALGRCCAEELDAIAAAISLALGRCRAFEDGIPAVVILFARDRCLVLEGGPPAAIALLIRALDRHGVLEGGVVAGVGATALDRCGVLEGGTLAGPSTTARDQCHAGEDLTATGLVILARVAPTTISRTAIRLCLCMFLLSWFSEMLSSAFLVQAAVFVHIAGLFIPIGAPSF